MSELTQNQKIALYRSGRYSFPPPPVFTGFWGEKEWIKYVDQHGQWQWPKETNNVEPTKGQYDATCIRTSSP